MSKHELDCPLSAIDSDVDAKDCVFCPIARTAYQRGREDAVQSVGVELLGRYGDPVNSALHEAENAKMPVGRVPNERV